MGSVLEQGSSGNSRKPGVEDVTWDWGCWGAGERKALRCGPGLGEGGAQASSGWATQ